MWTPVTSGVVTFVVLALIQSVVIPWVQANTRRRERWENDLLELHGLVAEVLPRALKAYKQELDNLHVLNQVLERNAGQVSEERALALFNKYSEASALLGEKLARLWTLHYRVARHPNELEWLEFNMEFGQLAVRARLYEGAPSSKRDESDAEWKLIEEARKNYARLIEHLVKQMRPPRRWTSRRWIWRRVRRTLGKPPTSTESKVVRGA